MQTPKKFSSFSDQVSWISDEKGIKIKDREYAEEMLRHTKGSNRKCRTGNKDTVLGIRSVFSIW